VSQTIWGRSQPMSQWNLILGVQDLKKPSPRIVGLILREVAIGKPKFTTGLFIALFRSNIIQHKNTINSLYTESCYSFEGVTKWIYFICKSCSISSRNSTKIALLGEFSLSLTNRACQGSKCTTFSPVEKPKYLSQMF
jgi:hypothetical protein